MQSTLFRGSKDHAFWLRTMRAIDNKHGGYDTLLKRLIQTDLINFAYGKKNGFREFVFFITKTLSNA